MSHEYDITTTYMYLRPKGVISLYLNTLYTGMFVALSNCMKNIHHKDGVIVLKQADFPRIYPIVNQ